MSPSAPPLTYLYCLVRSRRRPVLRRVPPGLPGAATPRALEAGDRLWLIAASVAASEYGEAAIGRGLKNLEWVSARAMAHEAVVEHFLTSGTVLPMQLFTIFTSDERAIEHVARGRRRIDRILDRVEGQLEWGLRLTWDQAAARRAVDGEHGARAAVPSGAAYLARKRDLLEVNRARVAEARRAASQIFREVARHATRARRRTAMEQQGQGAGLLLDAAYLVPARRAGAFRTALRRSARRLAEPGVVVSLTGPWPPYNFIDRR